jgi:hypothetical protein
MIVSLLDRLISHCSVLALALADVVVQLLMLLWVAVMVTMIVSVMVLDGTYCEFILKRLQ